MIRRAFVGASVLFLALASALAAQQPGPLPAPAQASPTPQQAPPQSQPQAPPEQKAPDPAPAPATPAKIEVPVGTHLPLVLHNGISTRSAKAGDPVYFETLFPIIVDNRVVIPAGSYVSGEITEAKRPGRVKGRAELMIRLNTLILPNTYIVSFNAAPGAPGTGGNESIDNSVQGPRPGFDPSGSCESRTDAQPSSFLAARPVRCDSKAQRAEALHFC